MIIDDKKEMLAWTAISCFILIYTGLVINNYKRKKGIEYAYYFYLLVFIGNSTYAVYSIYAAV